MTAPVSSSIAELRCEYHAATLSRADLAESPIRQFATWFEEALKAGIREPNALTLSTLGLDGMPNSRTLLMKDFSEAGVNTGTPSRRASVFTGVDRSFRPRPAGLSRPVTTARMS